jgi:hypothetical protein
MGSALILTITIRSIEAATASPIRAMANFYRITVQMDVNEELRILLTVAGTARCACAVYAPVLPGGGPRLDFRIKFQSVRDLIARLGRRVD